MQSKLFEIKNLTKKFPSGTLANDRLNLSLERGEVIGLIGPNGAGKTTFIRLLLGLLKPTAGSIDFNIKKPRENIGYVPQLPVFFPSLTVEETIYFPLKYRGMKKAEIKKTIDHILKITGIEAYRSNFSYTLSGGIKKMLLIAAALAQNVEILVFDEPTSMVDIINKKKIWKLITDGRKDAGIIIASHDMEEVRRLCDRIYVLVGGKFCFSGTADEMSQFADKPFDVTFKTRETFDIERYEKPLGYQKLASERHSLLFATLNDGVQFLNKLAENANIENLQIDYPSFEKGVENIVQLHQ